jgi:site-specific DNA-methyltransferase (adenine-specific)
LIEEYKIDTMSGFQPHEDLKAQWFNPKPKTTYNPQKVVGTPYKNNKTGIRNISIYGHGQPLANIAIDNKGDRFPASILKFDSESKTIHPTQKPTLLLEWLIKSYTNPEDIVLDFTMGSGTTVVACVNTNRKYIGIEMDATIYESAKARIENILLIPTNILPTI